MNHDFDTFVKQHLEDILCEVKKEHTLAQLREIRREARWHTAHKLDHHHHGSHAHLQDCAVSPAFSQSHL